MKTIFGAIVLALTAPAIAQTAPPADPHADHMACKAAQGQQQGNQGMDDMHKSCGEMMKHHGKAHHRAKTEAERLDAEVNGNGHQGHNH